MSRHRKPTKSEVLTILDSVPDRIEAIKKDVRWAANLGMSPKVRPQLRVSGSGHGDATGSVVAQQEHTRRRVKEVFGQVGELDTLLESIDGNLKTLFDRADNRKDYTADEPTGEHSKTFNATDRLVTKSELSRARDAQVDRNSRGEGYGAS